MNKKNNITNACNAYVESVKLRAKAILAQIDLERSVIVYYSNNGWDKMRHIIELKTADPEKERRCFVYTELVNSKDTSEHDPYVMAARLARILPNIPQWKDEIGFPRVTPYKWIQAKERQKMACPETGAFTAYKKVYCNDHMSYICELLIPEDALRSSGFERKCRADKAKVVAIWNLEYVDTSRVFHFVKTRKRVAHSIFDKGFVYRVGETVTPTNGFDTYRFNTCAPGIHFYMTMAEAANN